MSVCARHQGQIDPAYGDCAVLHLEDPRTPLQREAGEARDRMRTMSDVLAKAATWEQRAIRAETRGEADRARRHRAIARAMLHGHPELREFVYGQHADGTVDSELSGQ